MSKGLFVFITLVILGFGPAGTLSLAETGVRSVKGDTTGTAASSDRKVIVYYLYFNPRCSTCITMEIFSKEAVENGFADLIKSGRVEWHAYDMDSTEHAHFWNDFQLETKSLVMIEMQNGKMLRWKDCEMIWDLAESKADFIKYVQDEVRAYLQNQ